MKLPAKESAKAPQKRATSPMPADARIGDGYGGSRRVLTQAEADARIHERLGLGPLGIPPGGR